MLARRLPPPLVALAVALVTGACSDPTSAPAPSTSRPAERPLFGVVSGGAFGEGFNFPEAKDTTTFSGSALGCGPGTGWACVAPKIWKPSDFDVAIHFRDRTAWDTPESFRAMHGTFCQPYDNDPDVSRPIEDISHHAATFDDLNYRCRNHMMTALKASGYGVIYVTPNATVQLPSSGEAVIRWSMSTMRTSGRDWIDLWITPWEDNLKLPLDGSLAGTDLQGPPRRAIHVRMTSNSRAVSAFEVYQVDNFVETKVASSATDGYESILAPVSTRRDTFELRLSRTHVKFGMWKGDLDMTHTGAVPFASKTWVDADLPTPITWTSGGVVQFGHHSMNPGADAGHGGTWHWDDFSISPAAPFTIIKATNPEFAATANARFADSKHPDVTLATPLPATGARFLRFSAFGERVQVSFDGAKWIDATRQATQTSVDGRFHSYWMEIPAEVTSATKVSFKAKKDKAALTPTNEDTGEWRVRDVAVWVR